MRDIGECWSSIRGFLDNYSTKDIKGILGRAGVPVAPGTGTHKGPVLDAADFSVAGLDFEQKKRLVIGCIEEIVLFEKTKNQNFAKLGIPADNAALASLQRVLARVGYGISGEDVFPLTLQLDIETASFPEDVAMAIQEALRRYRDGSFAGAITAVTGAVDKITESIFSQNSLGDHKAASYQARVSKSFSTFEKPYCAPLLAKNLPEHEVKLIWENHKKAVSNSAYVLAAFRREYSDVHGHQNAPAEFVQKSLDCAVFILRSFSGVK
ncbi:MAG TPA: hypothetical protein VMF08_15410 [Candidatus Sulfotelmatobacter sp.]|nr:hypothetical protein [Candidatus Sulfotelmatobacter sp.]